MFHVVVVAAAFLIQSSEASFVCSCWLHADRADPADEPDHLVGCEGFGHDLKHQDEDHASAWDSEAVPHVDAHSF